MLAALRSAGESLDPVRKDLSDPSGHSIGMFVAAGARARLGDSERNRFLKEEWPQIRARMRRLGIDPATLLDRERA